MNTNTETLRPCEIEFIEAIRTLPDDYLMGLAFLMEWMIEDESHDPNKLTETEIHVMMETHPETVPMFRELLRGRKLKEAGKM